MEDDNINSFDNNLVYFFKNPGRSFRAQPLNETHVENIMKLILSNPYQKGKIWSIAIFKDNISSAEEYKTLQLVIFQ